MVGTGKRGRPAMSKEQKLEKLKKKLGIKTTMTDCQSQEQQQQQHSFTPPTTLEWKEIANNERYQIKDAVVRDSGGNALCTISLTTLNKHESTRGHSHRDTDETYIFLPDQLKGATGLMLVDQEPRKVSGSTFDTVYVPRGKFHRVTNPNHFVRMSFLTISPGETQRPPISKEEAFTEKRTIRREEPSILAEKWRQHGNFLI